MQSIILAAGMGKRLKELTENNTKCMIKVNGVTLIERMLRQLESLGLARIIIVIGYEGEKLKNFVDTLNLNTPIVFINNPIYDKTNNIYSLTLAKDHLLQDDTILLESDIIFETSILNLLIEDERESLALVDKYESWMDGTCIKMGNDDNIIDFIPKKKFNFEEKDQYYKTVNIYKFSKNFSKKYYVPFLIAYSKALGRNEYYEQVLKVITMLDDPQIKAKPLNGQVWYEIDDIQDLDIANSLFAKNEDEKLERINERYGGYWRFPRLLDFCYLVNPYYPTQKLKNELKANFDVLLTQYPSGLKVNSLLAAKNFNLHQEHIIVGNGAAELIKSLLNTINGNIGITRPTFEEYPNRYDKTDTIAFHPTNKDFSYSTGDLISFFSDKDIATLILINPDNPSGNYIVQKDLMRLLNWCKEKQIRPVIDESFVDFSDEEDATLLKEQILKQYPDLIVVKSISKSFGVPGLRLGVLASHDEKLIKKLKKDVSIWNINSFAEFYMQIESKYINDYKKALDEIRQERRLFIEDLSKIKELRVIKSQANYLMIEILGKYTSASLTKKLLSKYNIYIKDLSGKLKTERNQFIRIAVRNRKENLALIEALKELFRK